MKDPDGGAKTNMKHEKCGWKSIKVHKNLPGGGFKQFFFSPRKLGKISSFDSLFFKWVVKKPPPSLYTSIPHQVPSSKIPPARGHQKVWDCDWVTGLCGCFDAQAGDARKCTWHRIESWNSTWVPWTQFGSDAWIGWVG